MRGFIWVVVCTVAPGLRAAPTFYKNAVPVLQQSCQNCHRSGEAAQIPLLSDEDARHVNGTNQHRHFVAPSDFFGPEAAKSE
jgi:hypothetical protein